eukprot:3695206-Alexandrium_andersonii.AAC.1
MRPRAVDTTPTRQHAATSQVVLAEKASESHGTRPMMRGGCYEPMWQTHMATRPLAENMERRTTSLE